MDKREKLDELKRKLNRLDWDYETQEISAQINIIREVIESLIDLQLKDK